MTTRDVGEFYGRVWPVWCRESVNVELRPRAKSCPFRASVFRDEGVWWVLGDVNEEPRELLRLLLHELAHVQLGHVYGTVPGRLKVARALMDGASVPAVGLASVNAECKATTATVEGRREEREADAWVLRRLDWLWGTLVNWGDAVLASGAVRWVANNTTGGV